MGIIRDTRIPRREPAILPTVALVGLGMEESMERGAGALMLRARGKGLERVEKSCPRTCDYVPHCHHLRQRPKSLSNWCSQPWSKMARDTLLQSPLK